MPSNSDLIKWAEQGRLHTKYVNCTSGAAAAADTATITVADTLVPGTGSIAVRVGQTVMISDNAGTGSNKAIVTAVIQEQQLLMWLTMRQVDKFLL